MIAHPTLHYSCMIVDIGGPRHSGEWISRWLICWKLSGAINCQEASHRNRAKDACVICSTNRKVNVDNASAYIISEEALRYRHIIQTSLSAGAVCVQVECSPQ